MSSLIKPVPLQVELKYSDEIGVRVDKIECFLGPVILFFPEYFVVSSRNEVLLYATPDFPRNPKDLLDVSVKGKEIRIEGSYLINFRGKLDFRYYYPQGGHWINYYGRDFLNIIANYLLSDVLGLTYEHPGSYRFFYKLWGKCVRVVIATESDKLDKVDTSLVVLYTSPHFTERLYLEQIDKVDVSNLINELYHYSHFIFSIWEISDFVYWAVETIKRGLDMLVNKFGRGLVFLHSPI